MKVPITNIHIVGLGVAEQAILADATQAVIRQADVILGSARQLQTIQGVLAEPLHHADNQQATNKKIIKALPVLKELPTLKELPDVIACYPNSSIVVLASGDPLYYGIGRWFSQRYGLQGAVKGSDENVFFYPAISSIQAACHQLGFSLQDVTVISLHGRPLEKIRTQLHANKRLVVLTDKNSQPSVLAKECIAAGFTASQITVCENLGYPQQQVRTFSVQALCEQKSDQESEQKSEPLLFDPLHVSVIEVKGDGGLLPNFPGIPDEHYLTGELAGKGMISKREVRLVILSFMQVSTQDVVWDIGAGCGGVAIELAYWNETASVYAVEHHPQRLHYLEQNRTRFGVSHNLQIVAGRAPEILSSLPAPNKIFIGGSDGELQGLLTLAWQALPIGGVLVASAVMAETQQQLANFAQQLNTLSAESQYEPQIESVEVAITRAYIAQDEWQHHRKLPITVFAFTKKRTSSDNQQEREHI